MNGKIMEHNLLSYYEIATHCVSLTTNELNKMSYLICVDDGDKPERIEYENWVREGHIYTMKEFYYDGETKEVKGFKLNEITPNPPYEIYDVIRFKPFIPQDN